MSELKILGGQLRSYKGWLTQSINNLFELIKIPSSASNASSMVSRLEAALGELDERRHKVESCLESMEALDFGKDDDEDKKEREKYYAKPESTKQYSLVLSGQAKAGDCHQVSGHHFSGIFGL